MHYKNIFAYKLVGGLLMNILIIGGDNRTLKIIEYFRAAKNNVEL